MATYGVAHVDRGSFDYQVYDPATPRGLMSIPMSTCIGFRVLLRSYLWYVNTETLSVVLIQHQSKRKRIIAVQSGLIPSPTVRSVQELIHQAFSISIAAVAVVFIYAGRLD